MNNQNMGHMFEINIKDVKSICGLSMVFFTKKFMD